MLLDEWLAAWRTAAALFNESVIADAQARGIKPWRIVPLALQAHENEFLMALYARDEFDSLLTGPMRHLIFASWAVENRPTWQSVTDALREDFISRTGQAANVWAIPPLRTVK